MRFDGRPLHGVRRYRKYDDACVRLRFTSESSCDIKKPLSLATKALTRLVVGVVLLVARDVGAAVFVNCDGRAKALHHGKKTQISRQAEE